MKSRSIFTPTIKEYIIPPGVKLPKMSGLYMGMTNLNEYLDSYSVHMALNPNHDALKCRLFGITLGQHARTWYVNQLQRLIGSFAQLAEKFTAQFSSCESIRRPTEVLHKLVQGSNETLWDYIIQFSRTVLTVIDFNDQTSHSAFLSNIHSSKLYKYLLSHLNP